MHGLLGATLVASEGIEGLLFPLSSRMLRLQYNMLYRNLNPNPKPVLAATEVWGVHTAAWVIKRRLLA